MGNKVETKARANIKNSSVINRDRANRRKKVGVVERKFEDIKYKRGKSTTKSCKELQNSRFNVSHVTVFNYMRKLKKIMEGI